jgi:hypothetical protein
VINNLFFSSSDTPFLFISFILSTSSVFIMYWVGKNRKFFLSIELFRVRRLIVPSTEETEISGPFIGPGTPPGRNPS